MSRSWSRSTRVAAGEYPQLPEFVSQGSTFAVTEDSEKAGAAVGFATWAATTPEGIRARIASRRSSALPAATELRPVARKAFPAAPLEVEGGPDRRERQVTPNART